MLSGPDYIREIQKFTTSQYWNTGVRITAGVMVPSLIFFYTGWLAAGMPFLWGALFASLTDTPGPVRHRRNGLLAAIGFNTVVTAITLALSQHPSALFAAIIFFTFFFSLFGVVSTTNCRVFSNSSLTASCFFNNATCTSIT